MSSPTRVFQTDNYLIKLDLNNQSLRIDCDDGPWAVSYVSFDESGPSFTEEAPIPSNITKIRNFGFKPLAYLGQKSKCIDDYLMAGLELHLQEGKAAFLTELVKSLSGMSIQDENVGCIAFLAACAESGMELSLPSDTKMAVQEFIKDFDGTPYLSRPLGLYSWHNKLSNIFRQDRILQTAFTDEASHRALKMAIGQVENGANKYGDWLKLQSVLTSSCRAKFYSLLSGVRNLQPDEKYAFMPPTRSIETDLITKLYGDSPIPDDFDLMTELIKQIKSGQLDLSPLQTSGWYDYCYWAHEPMLLPGETIESDKLEFTEKYEEHLIELFKGFTALSRETHIKNASPPAAGAGSLELCLGPNLSVEPLPSYFLRRARGYDFIRTVLADLLEDDLSKIHGYSPCGPRELNLEQELRDVAKLFNGAFITSCSEIGLSPQQFQGCPPKCTWNECKTLFENWNPSRDEDLQRDTRMMVPVFYDQNRKQHKVWMFMGWQYKDLEISYIEYPSVEVLDKDGRPVKIDIVHSRSEAFYRSKKPNQDAVVVTFTKQGCSRSIFPYFAEAYVSELLPPDEFRKHCDKHKTAEAIIHALK